MKRVSSFLGEVVEKTRIRLEKAKEILPVAEARRQAYAIADVMTDATANASSGESSSAATRPRPFESAITASGLSFICEVKKASPSKGIIAEDFPWLEIAREYETGGAHAISVLTEPDFFMGSGLYLREIAANVQIPVLRKDFLIEPYQIYEAKIWGAKAVLLHCSLLEPATLSSFISVADELSLDCLVEIHNEAEAEEALLSGARIIGINSRDLVTFNVDTGLVSRLRKKIPADILTVAESGIKTADDVRKIKDAGIDAVLIGESLMRSADKKMFLKELLSV